MVFFVLVFDTAVKTDWYERLQIEFGRGMPGDRVSGLGLNGMGDDKHLRRSGMDLHKLTKPLGAPLSMAQEECFQVSCQDLCRLPPSMILP